MKLPNIGLTTFLLVLCIPASFVVGWISNDGWQAILEASNAMESYKNLNLEGKFSSEAEGLADTGEISDNNSEFALRTLEAIVTAYVTGHDNVNCISASGVNLCELQKAQEIVWIDNWVGSIATTTGIATDKIIACPSKYPFGTIVEIENEKYICLDRMCPSLQAENRFDIYMGEDYEAAMSFGRQNLKVKLLE